MIEVTKINIPTDFIKDVLEDVRIPFGIETGSQKRMKTLANSDDGGDRKLLRHLPITCKIKAPLAWWIEFDTYKVGCNRYSSSVMHTLLKTGFKPEMFEFDNDYLGLKKEVATFIITKYATISRAYETKNITVGEAKELLKSIIPGNFYYTSRVTLNYEVLRHIYKQRKNHQLRWWHEFIDAFKDIPYYKEFIKGE